MERPGEDTFLFSSWATNSAHYEDVSILEKFVRRKGDEMLLLSTLL